MTTVTVAPSVKASAAPACFRKSRLVVIRWVVVLSESLILTESEAK